MEEYVQLIQSVGFPIGITIILLYDKMKLQPQRDKDNLAVLQSLRDATLTTQIKIDEMRKWLEEESKRG